MAPVPARLLDVSGVRSELPVEARGRVELATRTNGTDDFWFVVNRTSAPVDVPGEGPLAPRQVRVLRRPSARPGRR